MPDLELGALGALGVVAGAIASVVGFGIGSLLTPALGASIGTKAAVAIVALPHAAATAVRLWALRKSIDRGVLMTFGLASAAGGLVGAVVHGLIDSAALARALGALLILGGLLELTGFGRRMRLAGGPAIAAGLASGGFGGMVGNQGGIRSAALLHAGLGPRELVATATATAMLVDLARVPVYLATSLADIASHPRELAVILVGVVIGTVVGAPLLRRLPEALFRRTLAVVLVLLGLALVAGLAG